MAVADHQTAGRGRLDRRWEAPPGANLLCSVLLRPDRISHLVTAAVALAGAEACEQVAGVRPDLKWPNDLMVADRKLAGVLAEVDGGAVVVGIGINVGWAPPDLPAACLGEGVLRDDVLDAMLDSLAARYGDWTAVAREYRQRCVTLNHAVRVEMADETFTGRASDVNDDGHLLVDVGACIRTITAADVIHLRPTDGP